MSSSRPSSASDHPYNAAAATVPTCPYGRGALIDPTTSAAG